MPGTVTVACKIENGIVLQLYDWDTVSTPVMAGGFKDQKMARLLPWSHKINGPTHKFNKVPAYQITDGYALTHGVDADNFARWLEQRKDTDMVKNGLVFAQAKPTDVAAQAHEHRNEKSDFAPIDPENLPPEFKGKIKTSVAA